MFIPRSVYLPPANHIPPLIDRAQQAADGWVAAALAVVVLAFAMVLL